MNEEQRAVLLNSPTACALIRMNGMVAENDYRCGEGRAAAYTERDFVALIDEFGIGYNTVISSLQGR
jgi:hypothetical protein